MNRQVQQFGFERMMRNGRVMWDLEKVSFFEDWRDLSMFEYLQDKGDVLYIGGRRDH